MAPNLSAHVLTWRAANMHRLEKSMGNRILHN
jgi:hypothetical protein